MHDRTDPLRRPETNTARSWWDLLTGPWRDDNLTMHILRRLNQLEIKMSAVDDMVTRFGAATDEIASDLDALRAEVANLDAGVAAKFEPLTSRLESLGADPANPIPPAPDQPV